MTTLKVEGFVISREHVVELKEEHPDTTAIDFSDAKVYSASAMHQFVVSFPDAKMTGFSKYDQETYDWVIKAINSDEWKHNQAKSHDND